MTRPWPITEADLRKALGFDVQQGDTDELRLFAQAACDLIDTMTGRDVEAHRHEKADGSLPIAFYMAARETAKLWWQQSKNGPRGVPTDPDSTVQGPPMGATLPRRAEGWIKHFPPPPGFGQPASSGGA